MSQRDLQCNCYIYTFLCSKHQHLYTQACLLNVWPAGPPNEWFDIWLVWKLAKHQNVVKLQKKKTVSSGPTSVTQMCTVGEIDMTNPYYACLSNTIVMLYVALTPRMPWSWSYVVCYAHFKCHPPYIDDIPSTVVAMLGMDNCFKSFHWSQMKK